jgi:uncharacterized repeat protein (TIGR02543 family)
MTLKGWAGYNYGAVNLSFTNPIEDTSKVKTLTITLSVNSFSFSDRSYYRLYPVNGDGTVVTSRYCEFTQESIAVRNQEISITLTGGELDMLTDDEGALSRLQWAACHTDGSNVWANFEIRFIAYELYSASDYHTVTFKDYNDATWQTVSTARGVSAFPLTEAPGYAAREGHTAVWKTEGGEVYGFGSAVTEDMVLVAGWVVNRYTLSFVIDGMSPIPPVTADYGTPVAAPAAPEKVGYTFAGWYGEGTFENEITFPYTVTKDATLYARWSLITYTVMVTYGDGQVTIILKHVGETVSAEDMSGLLGASYKLEGFYLDSAFTQKYDTSLAVTGNLTLFAKYTEEGGCGGAVSAASEIGIAFAVFAAAAFALRKRRSSVAAG